MFSTYAGLDKDMGNTYNHAEVLVGTSVCSGSSISPSRAATLTTIVAIVAWCVCGIGSIWATGRGWLDVPMSVFVGRRLAGEDSGTVSRDGLVQVGDASGEGGRERVEDRCGDVERGGAEHALICE